MSLFLDVISMCSDDSICGWLIINQVFYINEEKHTEFIKLYNFMTEKDYKKGYITRLIKLAGYQKIYSGDINVYQHSNISSLINMYIPINYLKNSSVLSPKNTYEKIETVKKICTFMDPLFKDTVKALLSLKNVKFKETDF